MRNRLLDSGLRLHRDIESRHWNGHALRGPDPGVRLNARVGRFVKSYLGPLAWNDSMTYMQAQSYWVLSNWELASIQDGPYEDLAVAATEFLLDKQRSDGAWDYPNPEWAGRIATVEGCFATLALLETHRHRRTPDLLEAAIKWHSYMESDIGYRDHGGVNYFAHTASDGVAGGVPNNSTLALWMLARLSEETGDASYLDRASQLVAWLNDVQEADGELPYAVTAEGTTRRHFLCYNYNAFEFLDLAHYHELTGDPEIWPVMMKLAKYLGGGLMPSGASRYECDKENPVVLYYTPAIARALSLATQLGLGDYRAEKDKSFAWVADHQLSNGNLQFYSTNNYGFLTDRRSYPRYLAMVLYHLITESQAQT